MRAADAGTWLLLGNSGVPVRLAARSARQARAQQHRGQPPKAGLAVWGKKATGMGSSAHLGALALHLLGAHVPAAQGPPGREAPPDQAGVQAGAEHLPGAVRPEHNAWQHHGEWKVNCIVPSTAVCHHLPMQPTPQTQESMAQPAPLQGWLDQGTVVDGAIAVRSYRYRAYAQDHVLLQIHCNFVRGHPYI